MVRAARACSRYRLLFMCLTVRSLTTMATDGDVHNAANDGGVVESGKFTRLRRGCLGYLTGLVGSNSTSGLKRQGNEGIAGWDAGDAGERNGDPVGVVGGGTRFVVACMPCRSGETSEDVLYSWALPAANPTHRGPARPSIQRLLLCGFCRSTLPTTRRPLWALSNSIPSRAKPTWTVPGQCLGHTPNID